MIEGLGLLLEGIQTEDCKENDTYFDIHFPHDRLNLSRSEVASFQITQGPIIERDRFSDHYIYQKGYLSVGTVYRWKDIYLRYWSGTDSVPEPSSYR